MPTDPADLVIDLPDDFRVHSNAYTSPEIFELEMQRIFERSWVYVAHESQIPEPGDFLTTRIGTQPVIVGRDGRGDLQVLLNRCRHRGSIVCRLASGRAQQFVCPYHSWTYGNDGALVNMAQRDGYSPDLERERLGLYRAAGSGSYRGLIFARLSGGGESLDQRLEAVRPYIDLWIERSPTARIRVTRAAHRITYAGNWKFQMENGVDGYHGNYVHSSFIRIADRPASGKALSSPPCCLLRLIGLGPRRRHHRTSRWPHGRPVRLRRPAQRPGPRGAQAGLRRRTGPGILAQRNILIFPNLFLFESHIRVMQPLSVSETIVTMLPTLLDGVPDAMNEARLRAHERFFGPAGFGTPDDVEMFVNCENGVRGRAVEWVRQDRGLHREAADAGQRVAHSSDETPQRSAYRQWRAVMQRQPSSGNDGSTCVRPKPFSSRKRDCSTTAGSTTGWVCSRRSASTGCRSSMTTPNWSRRSSRTIAAGWKKGSSG